MESTPAISPQSCHVDPCGRPAVVRWRVLSEAMLRRQRSRGEPQSDIPSDSYVCVEHVDVHHPALREPTIVAKPSEELVVQLARWVRDEALLMELWACDTPGCDQPAVINWSDPLAEPSDEAWPLPGLVESDILACQDHLLPAAHKDLVPVVLPEPACNVRQPDPFGFAEARCRRPAGPGDGFCDIHRALLASGVPFGS